MRHGVRKVRFRLDLLELNGRAPEQTGTLRHCP